MKASRFTIIVILVLMLSTAGCNLPSGQSVTPNAYTAAALTVTALAGTEAAGTPKPTATLFATFPPPTITRHQYRCATSPESRRQPRPAAHFLSRMWEPTAVRVPPTNYDKIASFAQGAGYHAGWPQRGQHLVATQDWQHQLLDLWHHRTNQRTSG